jgi:hypothetical protein
MNTGWKSTSRAIAILLLAAAPAFPQADSTTNADSLTSGELTVWISCHDAKAAGQMALRYELGLSEDFPNLKAHVKGFATYEYQVALAAPSKTGGDAPDIVFTDDQYQAKSLSKAGATGMIGSPRFAAPGSWLIPAASSHPGLARGFILWLEEPPPGKLPKLQTQLLSTDDMTEIRKAAIAAAEGFDSNAKAPGTGVLDSALADFAWSWLPAAKGQRYTANVMMLGGNQRLAFAGVSGLVQGDAVYGLYHATAILRLHDNAWQVIGLLPSESFPEVMKNLNALDALKLQNGLQSGITFLTLLSPLEQAQLPRGLKAEFEIEQEGELGGVLAIEYQSFDGLRELWSPTTLRVIGGGPKSEHILRSTMSFTGHQPYRCRAWSINQSGVITLSDWHTFNFAY